MPVMAIPLSDIPLPGPVIAKPPIALPPARKEAGAHFCDFSGDGRLVDAIVADRSAWRCPVFYLTMPVAVLLILAVATVRFYRVATGIVSSRPS